MDCGKDMGQGTKGGVTGIGPISWEQIFFFTSCLRSAPDKPSDGLLILILNISKLDIVFCL